MLVISLSPRSHSGAQAAHALRNVGKTEHGLQARGLQLQLERLADLAVSVAA